MSPGPPTNALPMRVDSGVGSRSPVEAKSAMDVEPLDTLVEDSIATSQNEKELHVDVEPTREHTRVDFGINIETPTKEPLKKLKPVLKVKPMTKMTRAEWHKG